MTVNRRQLLLGVGAVALLPTASWADCIKSVKARNPCTPDAPAHYKGTDSRRPTLNPQLCLSDEAWDLMTVAIQNGKPVRLAGQWDYALYYGRGRTPEVYRHVVKAQCYDRQWVHPGTIVIVWFNCIDRRDGRWYRHWLVTPSITASRKYIITEYFREPARGFEDSPKVWRLPS